MLPSLRVLPQLGSEQIGAEFPGSGQKAEGLITCTSRQATVTGLSWKLGSSVARLRSDNGEAVAGRHLHRNIRDASPVPRCVLSILLNCKFSSRQLHTGLSCTRILNCVCTKGWDLVAQPRVLNSVHGGLATQIN